MIQQKMSQFVLSIFNHTSSTDSMKRRRHTGTSTFLSQGQKTDDYCPSERGREVPACRLLFIESVELVD